MRKLLRLILMSLVILAATAPASADLQKLTLDPSNPSDPLKLEVLESDEGALRLELRLSSLDLEEFPVEGKAYQILTLPGGGIRGKEGQAGLPVVTRLVAIPDNAAVTARVLGQETQTLPGFRIFPVQPDEAEDFVIDRVFYSGPSSAAPAVAVGAPAIFHGLRVVPVTFSPVNYDPASGELTVSTRLEAELDLSGTDPRSALTRPHRRVPESFHRMYQDLVVNYEEFMRGREAQVGPGTYLLIHAFNAGVLDGLQPLIDWRQRQGYNVIVASTNETGSNENSIKNYIQVIYDTVDPPLEFVSLAGDASGSYVVDTWHEVLSGYYGEGDHYYSTLAGDDYLADVHVGRISFRSLSSLDVIVDKIVTYETNPPIDDAGWFSRAALTGDPGDSGITTIYINQWVKTQLIKANYSQIDTIFGGNYTTEMMSKINNGLTIFGYRGTYGMSGMSESHIEFLSNGYELPFAVLPTCGTGDFASDATCRSEAFLRAENGGGIGAIGTATWGTHTRFNNSFYAGTWDGAINGSEHRLGPSQTQGKLALYLNYKDDTYQGGNVAEIWSVWNTLIGDPATDMWTGQPSSMIVECPTLLPVGANSVPVTVSGGVGGIEGALVALFKDGQIRVSAYTDQEGRVNLPLPAFAGAGEVLVTVTKHNHFPHLGSLTLGTAGAFAGYYDSTVDDDSSGDSAGNGDGRVNPNESIELPVALRNMGIADANGVTATLSTSDPYVTVTDADETYGDLAPGEIVWGAEDFDFHVAADAPDGRVLELDLVAHGQLADWSSLIQLTVANAAFRVEDFGWEHGEPEPGQFGDLTLQIFNEGSVLGGIVTGLLLSNSPWVDVSDAGGSFGDVAVGASAENLADPFGLAISEACAAGHLASFTLILTFNGQAQDTVDFTLSIGSKSSEDPVGPDAYGYYAFDNTDLSYTQAPAYNWIEIDPNHGGPGSDTGLSDFGWEQDDVDHFDLPFTFRFYGRDYDRISICSNGFVAMGTNYLKPYTNWALPGVGGPDAMICPLWENLYMLGSNKVYHWQDMVGHRYVIQWSRMRNDYSNSIQNVQVILYDPVHHPTETGDGEILFQYDTVNNTDHRDGYVTVGIQNHDHTDGLLYTYWNEYAPGGATLSSGRAIRILPLQTDVVLTGAEESVPRTLTLLPNVPNPFNPVTGIHFTLPRAESVILKVYDTAGRLVKELLAGERMEVGAQAVVWNGLDEAGHPASSGIYYYVLETETERRSGKMTLLK